MENIGIFPTAVLAVIVLMLLILLHQPLKWLLRFLLSGVVGSAFLLLCAAAGLPLGLNAATLCIVSFLGAPGCLGLVAICLFL